MGPIKTKQVSPSILGIDPEISQLIAEGMSEGVSYVSASSGEIFFANSRILSAFLKVTIPEIEI